MFDGRLVTHCDSCGAGIIGTQFVGSHGLTELLGIGFCPGCADAGEANFTEALLHSGLLSPKGIEAISDWLHLQAPPEVLDLVATLRHGRPARPFDPITRN